MSTEVSVKVVKADVPVNPDTPITKIDIQLEKDEMTVGETLKIAVQIAPEGATEKVVYESGDINIVKVDENGLITALSAGTVKVMAKSESGQVVAEVTITVKEDKKEKKAVSTLKVDKIGDKTYTGKNITPAVTVKDGSVTLKKGTDYTLTYSKNKNVGTATVKITGMGNYTGSREVHFRILAAKGKTYAKGQNRYKVTNASASKGTVSYAGGKNKKASKIIIPATVKIGSVTYKVTAIEKNALKNYKKASSVIIGKNVRTIGAGAFKGCGKLKKITVQTKVLKKVGSQALRGINKKAVVKVPSKKLKAYRKLFKNKGQKKTVKIK